MHLDSAESASTVSAGAPNTMRLGQEGRIISRTLIMAFEGPQEIVLEDSVKSRCTFAAMTILSQVQMHVYCHDHASCNGRLCAYFP